MYNYMWRVGDMECIVFACNVVFRCHTGTNHSAQIPPHSQTSALTTFKALVEVCTVIHRCCLLQCVSGGLSSTIYSPRIQAFGIEFVFVTQYTVVPRYR